MPKKINIKLKKDKKAEVAEKITDAFQSAANELSDVVEKAKKQFSKMDKKTSQKVLAGVLGATILLAGAAGLKKLSNKKKNGI